MSDKSPKKVNRKGENSQNDSNDAWLSMRTGLIVITVVSIGLATWIAWNTVKVIGLLEGILWGLGFGAAVWGVFVVALLFNWFVRGKRG